MAKIGNLQVDTIHLAEGAASAVVFASNPGSVLGVARTCVVNVPNPEVKPIHLSCTVISTATASGLSVNFWSFLTLTRTRGSVLLYDDYYPTTSSTSSIQMNFDGDIIDMAAQANDQYTLSYIINYSAGDFNTASATELSLSALYVKR